ncbi:MAG: hypothetical protein ACTSWX_16010 [Promethearchaeota archaeon]
MGVNSKISKPKPKYYDENIIDKNPSKSSSKFAVFVIACIIIGASVSGLLIANSRNNTSSENSNSNGNLNGIKDGDKIKFEYNLYIDKNNDGFFTDNEEIIRGEIIEWTVSKDPKEGFPPAFYDNIIGMESEETKDFVIPATDTNHDGLNDDTGNPVWNTDLSIYNLKFHVHILKIN